MKAKPLIKRPKRAKVAAKPLTSSAPQKLLGKLVKIGNSRGIRLPKSLIEQSGLADIVEIAIRGNEIILRPANPRAGWDEAFKRSIEKYGPIESIDPDLEYSPNEFDKKDWTW